jgi:hypothetical protein
MSDFDNQLFVKVCELEGRLELLHKKHYECELLLKEIAETMFKSGLTEDNIEIYSKAIKFLENRL